MTRQIGIYSGTFDPVHEGHVAFAMQTLTELGLDQVVFLPEPTPRGKIAVTDLAHRIAMVEQAIQSDDRLIVMEPDPTIDQFTVSSTLPLLQQLFPDDSLTLLIGSDVARTMDQWSAIADLLTTVRLAIGMRSGDNKQHVSDALQRLGTIHGVPVRYICIDTPASHIASTHIRRSGGQQLQHPATADYIRHNRLYADDNS